ncbi:MAG: hypothetical protein JO329_02535 [Planctomycetaceae bacterium]|nr:hypothetical protein [Planctomycetaceae bacterium]MBV8611909.1 hypothetical protein [Singulisphaera sp.]
MCNHQFLGVDCGSANDQVAPFDPYGTEVSALGTGWDRAEPLSVVSEHLLDVPPDQGLRGVDGDLLEGVESDLIGRSGVAEGAAGDDFSPVLGQITQLRGSRRWGLLKGHRTSSLGLGESTTANWRHAGLLNAGTGTPSS